MNVKLRLYVLGETINGLAARRNIEKIIVEARGDACDLEVIDVLDQPERAERDKIIATPTLVKWAPIPTRRLVGDLSDRETVLDALDLYELSGRE